MSKENMKNIYQHKRLVYIFVKSVQINTKKTIIQMKFSQGNKYTKN